MLSVACPGCQSRLKMKSTLAGRRVKCPKCKATIQVPGDAAEKAPVSKKERGKSETPEAKTRSKASTQKASVPDEEFPVLPLASADPNAAAVDSPVVPDFTSAPELNFDVSSATVSASSGRRRKSRSSVGIWGPLLLVLTGAAGALWYFMPGPPLPEVVANQFADQLATEGKLMRLAMPVASTGDQQPTQFKIVQAPEGATLDQATREFMWTPSEADGPGEFDVVVHVIRGQHTVAAKFRVIVSEVDTPPVFEETEPVAAEPLEEAMFSVRATDPDKPSVPVRYSLAEPNSTAMIDIETGALTFTPTEVMAGELVTFKVVAKEESDAALSTTYDLTFAVAKFADPVRQLVVDLRKLGADAKSTTANADDSALPFTGNAVALTVADQSVSVFRYETGLQRQQDVQKVDDIGRKVFDVSWDNDEPLNVFAEAELLVAYVGSDSEVLSLLSSVMDRPEAVVQKYEAPTPIVRQTPALVAALLPIYEERLKRPGKPRRLFTTDCYKEVRKVFANEFANEYEAQIRTGLGDDYDELMEWFAERVDLKEELFTAINPSVDNVATAMQMFNEIRKAHPKQIDRYGSLAIACSVVWDSERGIYNYRQHANRTHSTMPDTLLDGLDNFQYFVDAESVMQGRAQFIPWEFLIHLVNHKTPVQERVWAAQAYIPTRQMFGKCYADVPYDTGMLQTKSRECKLDGMEYNLPNIRQFGGVCAMQADFAARVGKSMGVPAGYVSGSGKYGGAHAWVMWVELQAVTQRSIKFTLESHGRYRGDNYYVGNMKEPQSGKGITDRLLELRLHQVGMDAMAKRHSDRIMAVYPQMAEELGFDFETQLEFLSGAVALNPWSEPAWTAVSQISAGREFGRDEHKTMTRLLNQLFVNFAAFPDFTLKIFGDLISFEKEAANRIPYYYRLLEVYAAAKRPDLGFKALLELTDVLEQEDRSAEAIQALAVAIQKYPDEGQYIPKMLDRLEGIAAGAGAVDQTLAEFYASFLPKIPQTRGGSPSKYCMQMYERAVPVFEQAGQPQLAQRYRAGAIQMKAGMPQ